MQRFLAEGEAGLVPRSRRPKRSPSQLAIEVEDEIVAVRKELVELGHDAGAHTIAFHLQRRHGVSPSPSTIWRVLCRRGFIVPEPHKRPKSSYVRFEADQPNERWQLDITHWRLADGTDVEILNIIDDHSRLVVGSTPGGSSRLPMCWPASAKPPTPSMFPPSVLSDNGAVFTGVPRGGGRVALELELIHLGVSFRHSRPYHPQTCGKVERFHQTLKNWLDRPAPRPVDLGRPATSSSTRFVRLLQRPQRPHRALGRRTPTEAYQARPKAQPLPAPIIDPHFRVRRDRVNEGVITLRHNSRLHHIALGRRHSGQRVLVLTRDLDVRILTEHGELIRQLTLDPTKNYQPLRTS